MQSVSPTTAGAIAGGVVGGVVGVALIAILIAVFTGLWRPCSSTKRSKPCKDTHGILSLGRHDTASNTTGSEVGRAAVECSLVCKYLPAPNSSTYLAVIMS